MKEKELIERDYYINKDGDIFDNSLNLNNEDGILKASKKRIKEIYDNQEEEIKEVLK